MGDLHVKSYSPDCRYLVLQPMQQAITNLTDRVDRLDDEISTIKHAVYSHSIYAARQSSYIGDDISCVKMDHNGFTYRRAGDPSTYRCDALIQTCCQISSNHPDMEPTLQGYQQAELLKRIVSNPTKGDATYAEWIISDQADRGIGWRYDDCNGKLYRFNGVRWEAVSDHVFTSAFDDMARNRLQMVVRSMSRISPPLDRQVSQALLRALHHVESSRASKSMLSSAKLQMSGHGFSERLDRDKDLLGALNCIIDLKTGLALDVGVVRDVSMSVNARYLGTQHPASDVHNYFMTLFGDDTAMVEYMRLFLGMTLSGDAAQVYGCFVGCGSNGKSLTLEWLSHVLGDYYVSASPYIFFADKTSTNAATPYLAELDRRRLAVVEESGKHDVINVEQVKRLSGSETVNVRRLYHEPMPMRITHTQVLCTNSLPKIDVDDAAMVRRVVVVRFNMEFKEGAAYDEGNPLHRCADPELRERLLTPHMSEQLLAWLVSGCRDFYAGGRKAPVKPRMVRDAEREYAADNDALGALIEDRCDVGEGFKMESRIFNEMAKVAGVASVKSAMLSRGFQHKRGRWGAQQAIIWLYWGLRLKESP